MTNEEAIAEAILTMPPHWGRALAAKEHPQDHANHARRVAVLLETRNTEIMKEHDTWNREPSPMLHHQS